MFLYIAVWFIASVFTGVFLGFIIQTGRGDD
jgi:hypothetical protein